MKQELNYSLHVRITKIIPLMVKIVTKRSKAKNNAKSILKHTRVL